VLDIVHKHQNINENEVLGKEVDAIFIMMNPGSSAPEDKENDNKDKMVKTKPDKTQDQVMAVMEAMDWKNVRVLNISDLRNARSKEFYKLLREVAKIPSGEKHSIFSISRKDDLEELWTLKDNAPVIATWGVDDDLDALIAQCMKFFKEKGIEPIGWLKSGTKDRFYHPLPPSTPKQKEWREEVIKGLEQISTKNTQKTTQTDDQASSEKNSVKTKKTESR